MSKHAFLAICVVVTALMFTAIATADGPVRNDTLVPFFNDIRASMCHPTDNSVGMITPSTPLDALLFNGTRRGPPLFPSLQPASCNPLLAPDGHQITLREFKAATGRATVKCINTGTHSALHFSGLLPRGTYSVWLFIVNPNPPPNYVAGGTLGRTELSENGFSSSAAGEGQITLTTPPENLSVFGQVGPCFLDSAAEIHLVYHSDGMTHGRVPGPLSTWVVNARFLFP